MPYRPRSLSEENQYHDHRHSADRPDPDPLSARLGRGWDRPVRDRYLLYRLLGRHLRHRCPIGADRRRRLLVRRRLPLYGLRDGVADRRRHRQHRRQRGGHGHRRQSHAHRERGHAERPPERGQPQRHAGRRNDTGAVDGMAEQQRRHLRRRRRGFSRHRLDRLGADHQHRHAVGPQFRGVHRRRHGHQPAAGEPRVHRRGGGNQPAQLRR